MRKQALAAGLVLAPVLLAPTSNADEKHPNPAERAYLFELTQFDVPVRPPTGALQAGHWICDDLHRGISPEEVHETHFRGFYKDWGPAIVDAARHHLCPDTLTEGG